MSSLCRNGVMSSRLCKKLEGAIFPLWVHPVKDGKHDAVHALEVDEADHRTVRRRTSTKQRSMTLWWFAVSSTDASGSGRS